MKEIILKNSISKDKKIKNVSSTEIFRINNILIENNCESKYCIGESVHERIQYHRYLNHKKPELYIRKEFDAENKTKKISYTIKGKFWIKYENKFYPLHYEHSHNLETIKLRSKREIKNGKKTK